MTGLRAGHRRFLRFANEMWSELLSRTGHSADEIRSSGFGLARAA